MRYIGIDFGLNKVGVAISDESGRFAFPHAVIPALNSVSKINQIITENEVELVVVGKSVDLMGNDNSISNALEDFVNQIKSVCDVDVEMIDERFSSAQANRNPGEKKRAPQSRSVKKDQEKDDDAKAAAIILQSYLDRINVK